MATTRKLQPTLWRTCRVLANRHRLRILGCLLKEPDQTVTAISNRLHLPVAVTSQYLRALEARSLLTARRKGRYVSYQASSAETAGAAQPLAIALRLVFRRETDPVTTVFRAATAFTHPRRVVLVQALAGGAQTFWQLHERTGISARALRRHLAKLEMRGFITHENGVCALVTQRAPLHRALASMACQ